MIGRIGAALLTASSVLAGCAATPRPEQTDVVSLGSSAAGEPCAATRNWRDPAVPDPFARSYTITCRTVAASRVLGTVRVVPNTPAALKPIDAVLECGPETAVTLATGPARARRCLDRALGTRTVRLDVDLGDRVMVADATPALLPQLEEAVAILSGAKRASADATRVLVASVDLAALAPAAPDEAATAPSGGFDPASALDRGVDLNHKGLHVDASRVLNDALSRLPAGTSPGTRAELLLEVGLADSNIRFDDAARQRFDAADAVLAEAPGARTSFLLRKRDSYRALDLINRGRFAEALTVLDRLARAPVAADRPLNDPATLRLLNQPRERRGDVASSIAVPDTAGLSQLALDAQAHWGRSVALLALGDEQRSMTAIAAAANAYRPLENERIAQDRILWLGARIARQQGRLQARRGEMGPALDSFDRALDALRRSALANAGSGTEPAIAEAQLERAGVFARSNAAPAAKRATYAEAVDAVIASGGGARAAMGGVEPFLDLLVAEAAAGPRADTFDLFFRAVQAGGEPAVARQVTQLQQVVASDPVLGALVRDRAELEREITRLRYRIAAGPEEGEVGTGELERARAAAEQRLLGVNARLFADPRFRSVEERPATLAELRAGLRPGEAFLKLTELNRRIYGLYVDRDRTFAYAVADGDASRRAVDQLAGDVRRSIDGRLDQGKLVPFDDAKAYALFRLIAGPAADRLAATRALVVDPGGPLERLPVGVLVTRYQRGMVRADPFDYSAASFLAGSATISTALSPRSFLVSRALPPSRARRRFLGLGEHTAPAASATAAPVRVGFGCVVDYGRLTGLSRDLKPISRRELDLAAEVLGDPGAPMLTNAAFTDSALEARGDLDQYAVLHFATHGLQEGQWGCAKSPPALVTSFGASGSDGLLSFSEIAELRLDANLVVLSACDTASGVRDQTLARSSGQEEAGSTLEGLVRAFLTANARAVLATYWQVSAEAESDAFMRSFYASARGGSIGESLRTAQTALIRQPATSHPFYWAPYFLVGDGTKPMLSPTLRVARR